MMTWKTLPFIHSKAFENLLRSTEITELTVQYERNPPKIQYRESQRGSEATDRMTTKKSCLRFANYKAFYKIWRFLFFSN